EVVAPAILGLFSGHLAGCDLAVQPTECLLARNQLFFSIVRRWFGIPVSVHVAVAIVSDQCGRPGADDDTDHHGQITARGTAGYDEPCGIDMGELWSLGVDPGEGVLDVVDDGGDFDLWSETIVERDEGIALRPAQFED